MPKPFNKAVGKHRPTLMCGGEKIAAELIKDIKDDVSDAMKAIDIKSRMADIITDINDVEKNNDKIEDIIENNEGTSALPTQDTVKIDKLSDEIDHKLVAIEKRDTKLENLSLNIIKKIGDANIGPLVRKLVAGSTGEILPAFDAYVNECNKQHQINLDSIKKTFRESFQKLEPGDIMATRNLINDIISKHKSFLETLAVKREKIRSSISQFADHNLVIPFTARQDIEFILTDSFIPMIGEIVRNSIYVIGISYASVYMFYYAGTWAMFRGHIWTTIGLASPVSELSVLNFVRNNMLESTYNGGGSRRYGKP